MASYSIAPSVAQDALFELAEIAGHNRLGNLDYSGEISVQDAFNFARDNRAVIVDVRTEGEWQTVGVPNLANTASTLAKISWKLAPNFAQNTQFVQQLAASEGVTKDTPLLFICRSGGRSLDAAVAMKNAGYHYCFNITGGFEGDMGSNAQGWKASNLPWGQG